MPELEAECSSVVQSHCIDIRGGGTGAVKPDGHLMWAWAISGGSADRLRIAFNAASRAEFETKCRAIIHPKAGQRGGNERQHPRLKMRNSSSSWTLPPTRRGLSPHSPATIIVDGGFRGLTKSEFGDTAARLKRRACYRLIAVESGSPAISLKCQPRWPI